MPEVKRFYQPVAFNDVVTFAQNPSPVAYGDNVLLNLGTSLDIAAVLRASVLNANTTLSGVIVGTPVTPAVAADSLILSNITASGDILVAANLGGNSQAWLWIDSSASLMTLYGAGVSAVEIGANIVVNESGADRDFRIEGDTNTTLLVIDAGTDSAAHGSAVVAGAGLSISNLTGRTTVTSVGVQIHVPAATYNDTGAMATISVMADTFHGQQTHTATNARTYTNASAVYLEGPPVASSNVTITNRPQTLTVAAGKSSFTPTATVASASGADLTGIAVPATTLTLTGTTQVTAAQGLVHVAQPTLTDSSAVTVDTYASLYIANAPTTGGMVTLTAPYALWVDAGTTRLDGTTLILGGISYTVPPDDGDAGEQLQTNGSGTLTWEAAGSLRQFKHVGEQVSAAMGLDRILNTPIYRWHYKRPEDAPGIRLSTTGDFETEYVSPMAEDAPWAMHHKGRVFNYMSAFGHAVLAIQALKAEIDTLKAARA